jgi:GNAT superfamily N-acetyltransferase
MKEKLIIRKAEENDVANIIKLIKELATYEKLLHLVETTETDIKKVLFGEGKFVEVLLAEYDGALAGQALFFNNFSTFLGKPGIYLEDLYVKPEFRGMGIGKALLKSVINLARERNYGRVEWCVLDWNESAIDFYKNLGAIELEEWKFFRLTSDKF